jgi:DNA-binding transcriptional LysR family regulator
MPDELVLIVPPGHRWSRRREIPPDLLGAERLLVREEGSASRQVTERALQHVGARIGPTMELGHTEAIKQAVMAGLGVAFVSLHAIGAELRAGQLSALRLRGYRIRRHFHVIHNEARTLGASARAFMNLLEDAGGPDRGVSSRGKAVTRR